MADIIVGRNEGAIQKYGTKGCILLGKEISYVHNHISFMNNLYMDACDAHVTFICGKRGGGKCLTGDSLVRFADDKQKKITLLSKKYGKILSYDEGTKKIIEKEYSNHSKRVVDTILTIHTDSGKIISLTPEHPLFSKSGWIEARRLKEKDEILTLDSFSRKTKYDKIKKIEKSIGDFEVFDISVEDTCNFVANDIIVHNSYTMGVFAEGFKMLDPEIKKRLSIVLLDTMGIYWSMKHANKKEAKLLEPYGLEPIGMDVKIFTPFKFYEEYVKKGIPTDVPFSIDASEVTGAEWCKGFRQDKYSSDGILINETVVQMKEDMETTKKKYLIDDIIEKIKTNKEYDAETKMRVAAMFETAKGWGLFSDYSTPLSELAKGDQVTVLDVSCYATMEGGWDVKALVVGIVAQHLFEQRMIARKDEEFKNIVHLENYFESQNVALNMTDMPLVWLVIDEAHEFLPRDKEDWNAATMPLMIVMREGRQPGISLVVATQQPGKIHTDVITQSDIVIAHRVTAAVDVEALSMLAQSGNKYGLIRAMEGLPPLKGCAVMFDVANDKIIQMRVRPRLTWHGGASPNALE